jgi:hypothetical protein
MIMMIDDGKRRFQFLTVHHLKQYRGDISVADCKTI